MTDPIAVPRDPDAGADDAFVAAVVRVLAGVDETVPTPPAGDRWVERARRHGVLSPAEQLVRSSGAVLPARLDGYGLGRLAQRMLHGHDLTLVARVLRESGVDWALLKGPVLADVVHERAGVREASDLDLLVAPGDLRLAEQALREAGVLRMGLDWSQRTWAQGSEVPMLTPTGTVVDLHWHLVSRRSARRAFRRLDTHRLLSQRVTRRIGGADVVTLGDLDLVLHVLLHSCLDGCGRWRALLDVQQCVHWLAREGWTPSDLAGRAHALGLTGPAGVVLALTTDLLDPEVAPWRDAIEPVPVWARTVLRRALAPGRDPMADGLTRRLVRYVAPTTGSSLRGVLGYAWSRVVRLVRPDRTQVTAPTGDAGDPYFDLFLSRLPHG